MFIMNKLKYLLIILLIILPGLIQAQNKNPHGQSF